MDFDSLEILTMKKVPSYLVTINEDELLLEFECPYCGSINEEYLGYIDEYIDCNELAEEEIFECTFCNEDCRVHIDKLHDIN